MDQTYLDHAADLLHGAYDLHMHPAPSPFHRALDDIQLLKSADKAGMAGILLKSHYESTVVRAEIANRYAGSASKAYGAIALNWPAGGLNPYAVHNALKRGAKIVYMPTRDAANSLVCGNMPDDFFHRPGISILENGKLKSEIYDILDAVKQYRAALATGHISVEESLALCREAHRRGVRIVLTHPEFSRTKISAEEQKAFVNLGVWIEKCWYNIAENEVTTAEMAAHIKIVGAEHCFMTTDRGQNSREMPVEALRNFAAVLLEEGISEQELKIMMHCVPKTILGS